MNLLLTNRFQKSFERLDKKTQRNIKKVLLEILHNSYGGKKLKGELQGEYSWRTGKYRIVYCIDKNNIWLETVRHRKEVYR